MGCMVESTDVHVFEHNGSWYAFDPVAVHVVRLEPDEAACLKSEVDEPCGGSSLGYSSHIARAKDILIKKELLSSSRNLAPPTPRREKVEILVNASQTCNLACEYCFVDEGKFNYDDSRVLYLSVDHAERLLRILPEAMPWVSEFCIHFYGGEPLLNVPAMQKAVDIAKDYGGLFVFAITTNGTILSEEAISVLKQGKFSVVLSIDGPPHIHDSMRRTKKGEPTHETVLEFLSLLREPPSLPVRGSAVIRKGWRLRDAETYLNSLDVDVIKAQPVRLAEDHPLMLDEKERQHYITDMGNVADTVIENLKEGKLPKDDRFNQRVLQVLKGTRRTSFCGAGEWSFGIGADGTVLPCVLLAGIPGTVLGHIDDPPSTWVNQGKKWAQEHGPRQECASCWALPLCGGGCPAMLHVCGEDECVLTRAHCELALSIYGEFLDNKVDLLYLAGISE